MDESHLKWSPFECEGSLRRQAHELCFCRNDVCIRVAQPVLVLLKPHERALDAPKACYLIQGQVARCIAATVDVLGGLLGRNLHAGRSSTDAAAVARRARPYGTYEMALWSSGWARKRPAVD